jgi:hypothetical protein
MNRRSLLKGLLVLPVTPIATDLLDIDYSLAEERVLGWEIDQGGGLTLAEVAEKGGSPTGRIIECLSQTNSILARLPYKKEGPEGPSEGDVDEEEVTA